jgi:hypothetical protein
VEDAGGEQFAGELVLGHEVGEESAGGVSS